jgi:putative membrane protein
MDAVLQSFLSGFPVLLLHFSVTAGMLAIGVAIYTAVTPFHEFRLVREGNVAAAVSLSGAILGMAIPLAFCMAGSVNVYDILIWGSVTLALQLIAYKVGDVMLRGLPERIESGELAPALVLVAVKLAVAAINAAAVSR